MQTSMTGRPRPVTATVTKPKWMQIPNPDAMRKIRRRSVESNGSTASLTSLLDHDSYNSASEDGDIGGKGTDIVADVGGKVTTKKSHQSRKTAGIKDNGSRESSPTKSKSPDSKLSAWEKWVIEKAKDDRKKRQEEREKKKEAKAEKEKQEQEKRAKLLNAEIVRQSWLEKKNQEMIAHNKMEKLQVRNEKRKKEEIDQQIKQKAAEKFSQWQDMKLKEERERNRKIKEENQRIQQHEERRKQAAEDKFQEWLKRAHKRPKSAPNSYGYLSGKVKGYHDRSAYPQPSFCNPIPWQPPSVPTSQKSEKTRNPKSKVKPYKWNPEKYF